MKNICIRPAGITASILLIPFLAMRFTEEVQWTLGDFLAMGILIFGCAFAYELIARKSGSTAYRFGTAGAVLTTFLLTWVNLAVGIIGDDNPANTLYLGVPLVLLVGAMLAELKPQGMSRALFATAFVQAVIPVIAFLVWRPDFAPGVMQVFMLNAAFVVFWCGSALFYKKASLTS